MRIFLSLAESAPKAKILILSEGRQRSLERRSSEEKRTFLAMVSAQGYFTENSFRLRPDRGAVSRMRESLPLRNRGRLPSCSRR